jgi:hypothetical protein
MKANGKFCFSYEKTEIDDKLYTIEDATTMRLFANGQYLGNVCARAGSSGFYANGHKYDLEIVGSEIFLNIKTERSDFESIVDSYRREHFSEKATPPGGGHG